MSDYVAVRKEDLDVLITWAIKEMDGSKAEEVGFRLERQPPTSLGTNPETLAEKDEELENDLVLINRQGDLLTSAINVLRGAPPEFHSWSHHDIAEWAQHYRTALKDLLEIINQLDSERILPPCDHFPDGEGNCRACTAMMQADYLLNHGVWNDEKENESD